MPPRVYLETSVISYLAARPSRDVVVAGHQSTTQEWWRGRHRFELVISRIVLDEAGAGDPELAQQRLAPIVSFQVWRAAAAGGPQLSSIR